MDLPYDATQSTYVQVARGLLADRASLTLLDLAPATLVVGNPVGSVGLLPTGLFLDRWYAADGGMGSSLVPAVLALLDAGRPTPDDSHMLVGLPRIRDAGLEYRIQTLGDDVPRAAGACVLFIRPFMEPVTPSRAGATTASHRQSMTAT